jgi:hypothetical protein
MISVILPMFPLSSSWVSCRDHPLSFPDILHTVYHHPGVDLSCENRPVNRSASRKTGLEMSCWPPIDLLWVQITQSYPNQLRFSSLICPQSPCHTVIDPVFKTLGWGLERRGTGSLSSSVDFCYSNLLALLRVKTCVWSYNLYGTPFLSFPSHLWWNSLNSKEPKVCVQERKRERKRGKRERK